MNITPVSEQTDWLKILVYGPPDAGKTTFACSADTHPAFGKTLVVNIDPGLQSVRWTKCLQTPRIRRISQIDELIQGFASRSDEYKGIGTIVIDSLTELQRIVLASIAARKHKNKPRKGGQDEIHVDDYNESGMSVRRYVSMLHDLDCHVIATAHAKERRSVENGPVTTITPDLAGGLDTGLRGMFDCVWAMRKISGTEESVDLDGVVTPAKDPYVAMLTQATGLYVGKTRNEEFAELLPAVMRNPTLPTIYDTFTESLKLGKERQEHGQ